jgi:hypothetical protein
LRSIHFDQLARDADRPDPRARREIPPRPTAETTPGTVAQAQTPAPTGPARQAQLTGK